MQRGGHGNGEKVSVRIQVADLPRASPVPYLKRDALFAGRAEFGQAAVHFALEFLITLIHHS